MKAVRCAALFVLAALPLVTTWAAAGCADGGSGDDELVCSVSPPVQGNDDTQFDGGLGADVMLQEASAITVDIDGDGTAGLDERGVGNGSGDTIINYGIVTYSIAGDWVTGNGGDDRITNYGYVDRDIMGDEALGAGGDDLIINGGTVNGSINGEGGDDTVVILDHANGGNDHVLLLDGGRGRDSLIFQFSDAAVYEQVAQALVGQSATKGSITIDGETYQWANFETLANVLDTSTPPAGTTAIPIPTRLPLPTTTPAPTATPAPDGTTTLVVSIDVGTNDVNEVDGQLVTDSEALWVGNADSPNSYTGLRFSQLNLPKGATIHTAELQFYSLQQQWIRLAITITGEASSDSVPFASSRPSQRKPLTEAHIDHASDAEWLGYTWYTLVDVQPVVQEIVNLPDWAANDPLTLILHGTGDGFSRKIVRGFEGDAGSATRLVINYSP